MKLKNFKFMMTLIILIGILMMLEVKVEAASMGLSINKTSATVGDTFSVTISGINGKVSISGNSNVSISPSGTQWVEGSLTISGTAKAEGTGTITVTPIDASTTAAEPQEVTSSASRSITITKKEQPKQETPASTTTPATSSKPATTTTTPKTTTTTKKTETKTETKKQETPKVEEKKQEEDNFYINSIRIKGLKESGEQVQIELSPEFKKDVYEYTCNVPADIQRIDVEKDAGEFTNSVIVNGVEELKEGENIITLQLSAEDHQAKIYTIKANKEKKEEIEEEIIETSAELTERGLDNKDANEESKKIIQMPVCAFILMQILIICAEVIVIKFVPWENLLKRRRKKH